MQNNIAMIPCLDNKALQEAFTYEQFRALVDEQEQRHLTSGTEQSEERITATALNAHRMRRLDKQVTILPELKQKVEQIDRPMIWLVLAETWCGDGAQTIPVIQKIAACNPLIQFRLLLRDQHDCIMDAMLTNGSRSIPKLVCLDAETLEEKATWGPRPQRISEAVARFKIENPDASKDKIKEHTQLLYGRDRGMAVQEDFLKLVEACLPVAA